MFDKIKHLLKLPTKIFSIAFSIFKARKIAEIRGQCADAFTNMLSALPKAIRTYFFILMLAGGSAAGIVLLTLSIICIIFIPHVDKSIQQALTTSFFVLLATGVLSFILPVLIVFKWISEDSFRKAFGNKLEKQIRGN